MVCLLVRSTKYFNKKKVFFFSDKVDMAKVGVGVGVRVRVRISV